MSILFYSLSLLPKPLRSSYSPATRGFFISPICIFLPIYYPILYPHLPYLAFSSTSSVSFPINNNLSCAPFSFVCISHVVSITQIPFIPRHYFRTVSYIYIIVVSLFFFTSSTFRFSMVLSLCLAGSLLVALTARNQYIPFHGQAPLPCTSTPTLHS